MERPLFWANPIFHGVNFSHTSQPFFGPKQPPKTEENFPHSITVSRGLQTPLRGRGPHSRAIHTGGLASFPSPPRSLLRPSRDPGGPLFSFNPGCSGSRAFCDANIPPLPPNSSTQTRAPPPLRAHTFTTPPTGIPGFPTLLPPPPPPSTPTNAAPSPHATHLLLAPPPLHRSRVSLPIPRAPSPHSSYFL